MKVAITGTVGIPANYGGFETLVENLVAKKYDPDIQYIVYCTSKRYPEKLKTYKGAILKYLPFYANGWQALLYDNLSLLCAYFSADIILSLGGWNLIHPLLKLFSKKKVINNFDGLEFTRDKWNVFTQKIILFVTNVTAKYADVYVADNEIIQEFLHTKYGRESTLIEYGGDHACVINDDVSLLEGWGLKSHDYCFMAARIEPENNIELLLEAFRQMPNRKLVIAGRWETSKFGESMRQKYKNLENITLLDAIYDQPKLSLLRSNCKLYVHGHSVGGTNPSLVEAMCAGLPIATFDVSYNRATTENKALYFKDISSLKSILENMDSLNLDTIGHEMKEIAKRRYQWDIICQKYEALFKNTIL